MPRWVLTSLALVLAVAALVGGLGSMVRAQSDPTPTPPPTEYFPPYERDYGSSGVMIVPLGAARLVEDAGARIEGRADGVEARPAADEAPRSASLGVGVGDDLVLVQIRLNENATSPTLNQQTGSEVISVDTGAVAFTFEEVDPDALVIRGQPDDPCGLDGCPLSRVIAESGGEVVLLPGDRLIHNGPARYTYRLARDVPVPVPGATSVPEPTTSGPGAAILGFAAPGALPGFACSGGCRARLTIACAGGCRY